MPCVGFYLLKLVRTMQNIQKPDRSPSYRHRTAGEPGIQPKLWAWRQMFEGFQNVLYKLAAKRNPKTPKDVKLNGLHWRRKSESQKWTSKNVRIRFASRWVIEYFLGQFSDRPLDITNFMHLSTLWAYGQTWVWLRVESWVVSESIFSVESWADMNRKIGKHF